MITPKQKLTLCGNSHRGAGVTPTAFRLPEGLIRLLENPPPAGAGFHQWAFRVSSWGKPYMSPDELRERLQSSAARCGRRVPPRELEDAIRNAKNNFVPLGPRERVVQRMSAPPSVPDANRWPVPDWEVIQRISESGDRVQTLQALSPDSTDLSATEAINTVWPYGDPLLCIAGKHPAEAKTQRRSVWLKDPAAINRSGLIVPNPMVAPTGLRQDGQTSFRCLDNTGPRWFVVVEFDFSSKAPEASAILTRLAGEANPRNAPDLCAALLIHLLTKGAPLLMAVHSGGKSLHAWFPVHAATDDQLRPFFASACQLGADRSTWVRCQLVRMPGGTRSDGTSQKIVFLNRSLICAQ